MFFVAVLLLIGGGALYVWGDRRQMRRVNAAGVSEFNSYTEAKLGDAAEKLAKGAGAVLCFLALMAFLKACT